MSDNHLRDFSRSGTGITAAPTVIRGTHSTRDESGYENRSVYDLGLSPGIADTLTINKIHTVNDIFNYLGATKQLTDIPEINRHDALEISSALAKVYTPPVAPNYDDVGPVEEVGDEFVEVIDEPETRTELEMLRKANAKLTSDNYRLTCENDMFRRFHGSVDDHDRQVFMQSVIFIAAQALEYKFDEDRMREFFEANGECLHPQAEWVETPFGVTLCGICRTAVDPDPPVVCDHNNINDYGSTVGLVTCRDCGSNLPRAFRRHVEEDTFALVNAVGVSIPKGQPPLLTGLAPKMLRRSSSELPPAH